MDIIVAPGPDEISEILNAKSFKRAHSNRLPWESVFTNSFGQKMRVAFLTWGDSTQVEEAQMFAFEHTASGLEGLHLVLDREARHRV